MRGVAWRGVGARKWGFRVLGFRGGLECLAWCGCTSGFESQEVQRASSSR